MTYIKEIYGPLTKTTICLVMLKGIKPSTEEWDGYSIFSQNYLLIMNIVYKVTGINPEGLMPLSVELLINNRSVFVMSSNKF